MIPTAEETIPSCLTCPRPIDLPKVVAKYVTIKGKQRPILVYPPHCKRCRDRYLAGVLPVHPWWMRTAEDGASVARS